MSTRPKDGSNDWPDLFADLAEARRTGKEGIFEIGTREPRVPPLRQTPWSPSKNKSRTVIAVWLRFVTGRPAGLAWPVYELNGGAVRHVGMGEELSLGKTDSAAVFLGTIDKLGTRLDLAHEIGHCLLADVGAGRSIIEAFPEEDWKKAVKKRLKGLAMNEKDLYDRVPKGTHFSSNGNLMAKSQPGTDLTPMQVALIRTARELR